MENQRGQVLEREIKMTEARDRFTISEGNLEVLKRIPEMMQMKKYRTQLRKIVLDFLISGKSKLRLRKAGF
jgi:hypothetical protein